MTYLSKIGAGLVAATIAFAANSENVTTTPTKVYASAGGAISFDVNFALSAAVASTDLRIDYGATTGATLSNVYSSCIDTGSTPAPYDGGVGFKYVLWLDSSSSAFPTSTACGSGALTARAATFTGNAPSPFSVSSYVITVRGFTDDPNVATNDVTVCQKPTVTSVTRVADVTEGSPVTFNVNFAAVPAGCGGFSIPTTLTTANKGAVIGTNNCANVPDAATTCSVIVTTVNNNLPDGSLPVTLAVTDSTASSVYVSAARNATAQILDDEVSASVVATTAAASETGPTNGVITLSRGGSTTNGLALTSAIGGTATFTTDYAITAGSCTSVGATATLLSATIPAGATDCTVNIVPVNDTLVEGSETVTFAPPTGANVATSGSTATITIADNDAIPAVDITKAGACAEDAASGPVAPVTCSFTVSATSNTNPVQTGNGPSVPFALTGTATITADYKVVSGTDCTVAGVAATGNVQTVFGTPQVYTVCPVNDTVIESAETVIMTLTANAAAYTLTNASQTHTIADDDSLQTVTIAGAGNPAEAGTVTGTFTLTRAGGDRASKAANLPVNVTLTGTATLGASCAAGVDYTLTAVSPATFAANVVTFVGSATTAVVTLTPCDDTVIDPAETAIMTVAAPSALPAVQYTPTAPTAATLTIIDDELAVNAVAGATGTAVSGSVNEGGAVVFSVSCPALTSAAVFSFSITPALSTGDVFATGSAATGTVTCPAAAASNVAVLGTINSINDTTIGNNRTYTMTLTKVSGAANAILGTAAASVNVLDDDRPQVIPTMGAFGLGLMSLLLAGIAGFVQRRRTK